MKRRDFLGALIAGSVIAPAAARAAVRDAGRAKRPAIIAIDAGHGGKDPGCISASDHYEKYVALGIADKVKRLLDADPRFHPYLTRDSDIFLPLHERVVLAHKHHADLFVSLHADSAPHTGASGASVYMLSEHGSSSTMARWLAQSENSADRYASHRIQHSDNGSHLQSVLMDLHMRGTLAASEHFGQRVLHNFSQVTNLHQDRVNYAAFAVLKSATIPSLLVEHGFMSNRHDCRLLLQDHHQQALAEAMHQSIRDYFDRYPLHA